MDDPTKDVMPPVEAVPPSEVQRGLERLMADHMDLSDFIFSKKGVPEKIGGDFMSGLCALAKQGAWGPNDPPSIWLQRFLRAMKDELRELDESIAWKWWRPDRTDMQNVRVELIDIFHFLLSAMTSAGLTGGDLAKVYYEKRKLNFDRQIQGFKKDDNKDIGRGV